MLKIAKKLDQLSFRQLMDVYEESNRQNGWERYGRLPESHQIIEAEQDFYQYLNKVFFRTSDAVYAIWEEQGTYVSALRLEPYRDGHLLEALETAPPSRRQGYAEKLIRAVQDQFPNQRIYSHVGKKNVPSLRVHEKCGFRRISEYAAYIDGSVNQRACTLCWEN
jgi:RimJ/RimL family protein N-acetyltransferase